MTTTQKGELKEGDTHVRKVFRFNKVIISEPPEAETPFIITIIGGGPDLFSDIEENDESEETDE